MPKAKKTASKTATMTSNQDILIANGFVELPQTQTAAPREDADRVSAATLISNLARYGYTLNKAAFEQLLKLTTDELTAWWADVKPVLAELSKENRSMDKHVVYKNFPREVLQMDEGEYVLRQMLIYHGFPYDMVAEEAEPRAPLGDIKRLKVLAPSDEGTTARIFQNLVANTNRWSDNQKTWASRLVGPRNVLDLGDFGFKENGIALIAENFETKEVVISTATDTLRLAAALSGADISLREKVKLRKFSRPERRKLLAIMDEASNLGEDFATRPEQFKRLLERLRPGDYGFENVKAAQDGLYNKTVKPFSALVDPQDIVPETLDIVATRPGEFLRRFHHFYDLFGGNAVDKMIAVMDKLTTRQLVNFRRYIATINDRSKLMYPPKANWAKAQIVDNKKGKIARSDIARMDAQIGTILSARLREAFPEGFTVDESVAQVKLQTNDQKLAEYGRGTTFDIPEDITFIRSASYWKVDNWAWFDNGWNFFDENWTPQGTLSWNQANFKRGAAIFSGDPFGGKTTDNRACQMIDLYIDKLISAGVRYAVWNVLCYSRIKFSDCWEKGGEVISALQLGEGSPDKGKLFEPSRATMVFPLKSDAYASYIAYVDLVERKVVYMDAPLRANVSSAAQNEAKLAEQMPAYVEYLRSLPSVYDLIRDSAADDGEAAMPVLYTDRDLDVANVQASRAFVFQHENPENTLERVSIAELVGS